MAKSEIKKVFKYPEIKSQDFQTLVAKLGRSPTQAHRANRIKKFLIVVDAAWEKIFAEFKEELLGKYAKKDDKGEIVSASGTYEDAEILPENMEAYQKDFAEFQKRTIEIECVPLCADTVADIKITGRELQALGDLYNPEAGPGVPHQMGVVR